MKYQQNAVLLRPSEDGGLLSDQHTRKIGIRISLGATPAHVLKLVTAEGMKFADCGFVIGTMAAFFNRRLMASSLTMIQASYPAIM